MKVIKVVHEENNRLVSTFASGQWKKEYVKGIETKPDTGYLFAFSSKNLDRVKRDFGNGQEFQFWLAEAKVVGRMCEYSIDVIEDTWLKFWKECKLRIRLPSATYLLCSSITLIKRLP